MPKSWAYPESPTRLHAGVCDGRLGTIKITMTSHFDPYLSFGFRNMRSIIERDRELPRWEELRRPSLLKGP